MGLKPSDEPRDVEKISEPVEPKITETVKMRPKPPELTTVKSQKSLDECNLLELQGLLRQLREKLDRVIKAESDGQPVVGGAASVKIDHEALKKYLHEREQFPDPTPKSQEGKKMDEKPQTDPLDEVTPPPLRQQPEPVDNTVSPSAISRLEGEIEKLKKDLAQAGSFAGDDVLFCPASGEPMNKVEVDGEIIDVSNSGCWFDGGELFAIIGRNQNFLGHLLGKISAVAQVETAIDKEKEIESRKKLITKLCQQYLNTQDQSYKKLMDFHNGKVRSPQGFKPASGGASSIGGGTATAGGAIPPPSSTPPPQAPSVPYGSIKCPASGVTMTKQDIEGITLDVSSVGIWFDGKGHDGNTEPELISILNRKPGFLRSLLGHTNPIESIEQSVAQAESAENKQQQIAGIKRSIATLSGQISRLPHTDEQFMHQLGQLKEELIKLDRLTR